MKIRIRKDEHTIKYPEVGILLEVFPKSRFGKKYITVKISLWHFRIGLIFK